VGERGRGGAETSEKCTSLLKLLNRELIANTTHRAKTKNLCVIEPT
jgi:hypothetical protein